MRHIWKNIPAAIAIILLPLIVVSVHFTLDSAIQQTIEDEAEHKAIRWATHFAQKLPQIENLIETGTPTDQQSEVITSIVAIGDVFRFKLFRPDGTIVIVSDETNSSVSFHKVTKYNRKAISVFDNEQSLVFVKNGTNKKARPDVYAEAYVLAKDVDGRKIGVVEVYINQTYSAGLVQSTFSVIGYGLPLLCGFIYLFTSVAFLWRDVKIRRAEENVRLMSLTDELTGLNNRRAFYEKLEGKFPASGANRTGIIFFDADNFKLINDEYGHEGGDKFLIHISEKISDNLRESDMVARMGGDEFVVTIDCENADQLGEIAERMLSSIREPLDYKGNTIVGNMSAGCYFPDEGISLDDAMNSADLALYSAKSAGKDSAIIYTNSLRTEANAVREIESSVTNGLKDGNFSIEFQPLASATDRKTVGFEALLRLEDGKGGRIPPDVFIPVAERIGFIGELGEWVLQQAISVASAWPKTYILAVNLSPRQFEDGRLVETVSNALIAANFPASQLELEISESLLLNDSEHVLEQLEQLKRLGTSIAMDDFGTGYSSLSHLWKFGFNTLKIDQSFLLHEDSNSTKLYDVLKSIIDLGHKMGMTVTAEGVETDHLAEMLVELKCDQLQGYLLGRPMPVSDLAPFISKEVHGFVAEKLGTLNQGGSEKAV
ncbi:MAG: hypothetical protein COB78_09160 [Hyphomicrobiales bacterium]|nr:MAG: hypothetical protein COB78_09160 [Hyphomicrobiales bacterium]